MLIWAEATGSGPHCREILSRLTPVTVKFAGGKVGVGVGVCVTHAP